MLLFREQKDQLDVNGLIFYTPPWEQIEDSPASVI